MHDIVAHSIAVMIALADGAAYTAAESPDQAVTVMGQVSATGRSALAEMRRLLGVMRQPDAPEHSPQPTLADVDDLLATVRAVGLSTRFAVTGEPAPLPPSAQLALYRILQEALTNVLKHASAMAAEVHLTYLPGEVGLEVTDDGKHRRDGQPGQPGTGSAAGHGIIGMRERAAVFSGEVPAGPCPGGGWPVAYCWALAAREVTVLTSSRDVLMVVSSVSLASSRVPRSICGQSRRMTVVV
jgi:signal transduction histidine kinase